MHREQSLQLHPGDALLIEAIDLAGDIPDRIKRIELCSALDDFGECFDAQQSNRPVRAAEAEGEDRPVLPGLVGDEQVWGTGTPDPLPPARPKVPFPRLVCNTDFHACNDNGLGLTTLSLRRSSKTIHDE